jgi:hypothetical protein
MNGFHGETMTTNGSENDPQAARSALVRALRRWNNSDPASDMEHHESTRELLDRLEREDLAAAEKAKADVLQAKIDELSEKLDRLTAQTQPRPPQMTRIGMTPKQKSDYIQAHGIERYNALPWK